MASIAMSFTVPSWRMAASVDLQSEQVVLIVSTVGSSPPRVIEHSSR